MTEVIMLPAVVKRLRPLLILMPALILLVACLHRKPTVSRDESIALKRFRAAHLVWSRAWFRRVGPLVVVISVFLVLLADSIHSAPPAFLEHGRAQAASPVSSRGGLRIPGGAVLGATPPPVPVIAKPAGPPSPDPVLLAVARLALTPTPAPHPTASAVASARRDIGVFRVTGYSDSPFLNGTDGRGITKSGAKTHWGCVAVDPRVIPLGTRLEIENYEGTVFTALDTGGGIKGHWIDIWFPTDYQALEHGLRELAITIVGEN